MTTDLEGAVERLRERVTARMGAVRRDWQRQHPGQTPTEAQILDEAECAVLRDVSLLDLLDTFDALASITRERDAMCEENERLRDKLLVAENNAMAKAQDIYIGELCARQAAESAIPIAFKAGWEATKTGNFHVDGGRETACKMFLGGFDFADEDDGEDLSIPQRPISFQGAVERGAEAVWRARYAHALGKARPTPWSDVADSQRAALRVEADACIRAALVNGEGG